MGEQVGAGSLKKDHSHKSVLYRTDMLNGRKRKMKPVMLEKREDMLTYFSRVVLFHITGFYQ